MYRYKCNLRSVFEVEIEAEGDCVVDAYRNASKLAHDIKYLKANMDGVDEKITVSSAEVGRTV